VSAPPIVDAVWGTRPEPPRRRMLWAAALGVGAHAVLLGLMWRTGPSLETWAADVAIRVHQELVRVEAVDLEAPESARPEQPEPEAEPEPEPVADPEPTPSAPSEPEAPPADAVARAPAPRAKPAAAAEAIATEPTGPVDLSEDVIVRGSAEAYAGGSTTSSGTSTQPVNGPIAKEPPGPTAPSPGPTSRAAAVARPPARARDRSEPARPREADWDCPWPRAANALEIDEQSAIVRAQLDARGRVLSVAVELDPGHGFGAAAAECARRARFVPARDSEGRRIPARTPPIRVQFTR
jgi:protein TonB